MKKLFTLLFVFLAALGASAEEVTPTALWGKAFQNNGQTSQGYDLQLASDGSLYAIGTVATKTVDDEVKFGNDKICGGTEYKGTGTNGSVSQFLLSKITKDGNVLWTVRSDNGDAGNLSQFVAPVSDGVICFFSMRYVENGLDKSPELIDKAGNHFSLNMTEQYRWYQSVVMKVSDEGLIQWMRIIDVNHAKLEGSTNEGVAQGIYPGGMVIDADENIYIGGNQRTAFTLKKEDNSEVTIEPRNVQGWDGKTTVGDLYLIKLDKNGYYLAHQQTSGTATSVSISTMTEKNGKIYLMGLMKGAAEQAISLGGKTVNIANANEGLFTAAVNTDLTAEWFQLYSSDKSGGALQTAGLFVGSDYLWAMGKTNMQKIGGKEDITTTLTRAGVLLKINLTDGALIGGYVRNENQAGFFDAFEGEDGFLYAATHVLNKPMSLYRFDKSNLSKKSEWTLIDNTSDTQGILVTDDGVLFSMTRANSTSNKLANDETKTVIQSVNKFSCNVCAFQLPVKPLNENRATFDFANNPLNWAVTDDITDYDGAAKVTELTVNNVKLNAIQNNEWVGNILYKAEGSETAMLRIGKFNAFSLTAPEGKAVVKASITMATEGQTFDFEASNGALADNVWTGNASVVTFTTQANRQIAKIEITLADENEETIKPAKVDVEVADIAAFNAVEDGKVVKLTLTNARVNGVKGGNYYVEDATGATVIKGVELTAGTALNGYIIGTKSIDASVDMNSEIVEHQLTATDASTFEASATTLEGTVMTIDAIGVQANYGKLITVENVAITGGGTNKTLTDAANHTIKARDDMGVLPADYTWPANASKITGVLEYYVTGWSLMPISADAIVANTDGISEVNAADIKDVQIYNLQGVRMNSLKKGLNIVNGKKIVIK